MKNKKEKIVHYNENIKSNNKVAYNHTANSVVMKEYDMAYIQHAL